MTGSSMIHGTARHSWSSHSQDWVHWSISPLRRKSCRPSRMSHSFWPPSFSSQLFSSLSRPLLGQLPAVLPVSSSVALSAAALLALAMKCLSSLLPWAMKASTSCCFLSGWYSKAKLLGHLRKSKEPCSSPLCKCSLDFRKCPRS